MRNRNGVVPQTILAILEPLQKNPFFFSTTPIQLYINTWIVRKDCPFRNDITKVMMETHEFGFYNHYKRKMALIYKNRVSKYGDMMAGVDEQPILIDLPYFLALCRIIVPIGMISAFLVFIAEIIPSLRKRAKTVFVRSRPA